MPRTIELTVPSDRSDQLVAQLKQVAGVLGLRVQHGVSVLPPGDVITIDVTTQSANLVMKLLQDWDAECRAGYSLTSSEPLSVVSSSSASLLPQEASEATWEEMEVRLIKEGRMTVNALLLMAGAGTVAAAGLATGTLHLVIGAMVIAPGFEPISRVALGAVAQSVSWRRGLADTAKGYAALLAGAIVVGLILRLLGRSPLGHETTYLSAELLVSYWTSITLTSLLVSTVAGAAGALLIATNRSVLTAGVMIALALIPTMSITGLAVMAGDAAVAGQSVLRWGIDVGLVAITSTLIFGWKRARVHQRKMAL